MIPTPHLVVFYNGVKGCPEKEIQRLSDSYSHTGEPEVEIVCTLYNINSGNNEDLMDKCPVLREFLSERRDEVIKAMTIDMTFEARERIIRKEEREQGISQGITQGITQGILTSLKKLMTNLQLSAEEAIDTLGIAPEETDKYLALLSQSEE